VPSAAYDTAATSSYGLHADPFIRTGRKADKIFRAAIGHSSVADDIRLLEHDLRDGAQEVHMVVPGLSDTSLISAGKLADEGYVSIFDKDEVTIITVSRSAILKGWRSEHLGLWRIPLKKNVDEKTADKNMETVLVNKPPTEFLMGRPPPTEAIFNVYELKKQPEIVRYYHAAAGFPTKPTWLRAINNGHYMSWPGLTGAIVQNTSNMKIHDQLVRWWYVRKGFHRGMRENYIDALDETYYE